MMNRQKGTVINGFLWLMVVASLISALIAHYMLDWAFYYHVLMWSGALSVALVMAAMTSQGRLMMVFVQQAHGEMRKIVWPTRQESLQTAFIVLLMVLCAGVVLWGIDTVLLWSVGMITS